MIVDILVIGGTVLAIIYIWSDLELFNNKTRIK